MRTAPSIKTDKHIFIIKEDAPWHPFLLYLCAEEDEEQSVDNACGDTEDDDRAGDRKELDGGAGNKTFGTELHRRRHNGVGKARDRDERTGAGVLGDFIIEGEACQHGADENERDAFGGCRKRFIESDDGLIKVH